MQLGFPIVQVNLKKV